MWVSMRSDDTEDLASTQGNITRLRLILQGERTFANTDGGAAFTPSVEIGLRHDAEGYEEWGLSGAILMSPGASGRGLTVSVAPEWGHTGSASQHLWGSIKMCGVWICSGRGKPLPFLVMEPVNPARIGVAIVA